MLKCGQIPLSRVLVRKDNILEHYSLKVLAELVLRNSLGYDIFPTEQGRQGTFLMKDLLLKEFLVCFAEEELCGFVRVLELNEVPRVS